jgi:hypothetical protein
MPNESLSALVTGLPFIQRRIGSVATRPAIWLTLLAPDTSGIELHREPGHRLPGHLGHAGAIKTEEAVAAPPSGGRTSGRARAMGTQSIPTK